MKKLILLALVLNLSFTFSQKNPVSEEIIVAIATDVWFPFIESYSELDSEKLKSIHSKDIIRVNIDPNTIEIGEAYLENFGGFIDQIKSNEEKVAIAFAIETTAIDATKTIAYQTGYYEFSAQQAEDKNLIVRGYGYFNVTLKKENGKWKIAVDADKHAKITSEEFDAYELLYRME